MARSRNIKPGFFRNELLLQLPFEYRLLFIGLWTISDRAGRFEDRPTRIKIELFPVDNVDVDAGLQSLHDNGFITRYSVDGIRYCQVLAWCKHQNPHLKEAASTIPAPDSHDASTVLARLIPDSLNLIPDSRTLEQQAARPTANHFDEFWAVYPRKLAKPVALKAFTKLAPDASLQAVMLEALRKQAASEKWRFEPQYIPYPATWINGRRWEDEIEQRSAGRGAQSETPDYLRGAV